MTRFDPSTDAGLDALLGAVGLPAGAAPVADGATIRRAAVRPRPPRGAVVGAALLVAATLGALLAPTPPAPAPDATARADAPVLAGSAPPDAPLPAVVARPDAPTPIASPPPVALAPAVSVRPPPPPAPEPAVPDAPSPPPRRSDPSAEAPPVAVAPTPPAPDAVAATAPAPAHDAGPRVAAFLGAGPAAGFGVLKGPPAGVSVRGGVTIVPAGRVRPVAGLLGEATVLPGRLGVPTRFVGGADAFAGVGLGERLRVDITWTAGARGVPTPDPSLARWVAPGGAFVTTGPRLALSGGRAARVHAAISVQALLDPARERVAPWVGFTVGVESPPPPR